MLARPAAMWNNAGMDIDPGQLLAVAGVFLLAGVVKGVIGLGLPTVSMGLMGAWMAAADAAALLVVPTVLTNVWQMLGGPYLPRVLRRLWPLLAALAAGTVAATAVITGAGGGTASILLGSALVLFAVLGFTGLDLDVPPSAEKALGPAAGGVTGLIAGSTGILVVPVVPYVQGLRLEKTEFTQAIAVTALLASAALGLGLALHGGFAPVEIAAPGAVATLAAFAGMAAGQVVRGRLDVETFRTCVLVGLAGLGAAMIVRAAA